MGLRSFLPGTIFNTHLLHRQLGRPFHRALIVARSSSSAGLTDRPDYVPETTDDRPYLIPAPKENAPRYLERRANRALPPPENPWGVWLRTFPLFVIVMTISALTLFNYEKSSSSVVNATLYALRHSEEGRRELGNEIYFRDKFPWIWGEMNQLHGRINICYGVKGTKASGLMRFRSTRATRMGFVGFPSRVTSHF